MSDIILFYRLKEIYGAFGNFSKHEVNYKGLAAPTSEHMFQAMKFYPDNLDIVKQIIEQPTPRDAANMGRDKSLPLRKDWDKPIENSPHPDIVLTKDLVMFEIVMDKFTRHEDLKQLLLSTGTATIVEDSPIDWYWGWGKDHTGQNKLGKILMVVRETIRKQQKEQDEIEYQELLVKAKEWDRIGIVAPMACTIGGDPILDSELENGSVVYIPWAFPSYDECKIEVVEGKVLAKGIYGIYELKYGPNWYVVSGLD